jgi:hypothetical protein
MQTSWNNHHIRVRDFIFVLSLALLSSAGATQGPAPRHPSSPPPLLMKAAAAISVDDGRRAPLLLSLPHSPVESSWKLLPL